MPVPVTERFRVRDDQGVEYHVVCVQREIDTSTNQMRSSMPGLPEYWLADFSSAVNFTDKHTFEIVATGKRVRRIP
jgi:hypothetical protein